MNLRPTPRTKGGCGPSQRGGSMKGAPLCGAGVNRSRERAGRSQPHQRAKPSVRFPLWTAGPANQLALLELEGSPPIASELENFASRDDGPASPIIAHAQPIPRAMLVVLSLFRSPSPQVPTPPSQALGDKSSFPLRLHHRR
jgi:hypothetical protein